MRSAGTTPTHGGVQGQGVDDGGVEAGNAGEQAGAQGDQGR